MKSGRWVVGLLVLVIVLIGVLAVSLWFLKPDAVSPFVAVVAVLISSVGSFGAWFTIREMQLDRAERNRPWVVVDFPGNSFGAIHCRVRNMGPGLARTVSLDFDPVPIDVMGNRLTDLSIFQTPMPILAPGAEVRQLFYFGSELFKEDVPRQFTVTVSYEGEAGFKGEGEFYIDLEQYRGHTLPPATVEEHLGKLEREIEKLVSHIRNVSPHGSLIVETFDEHGDRMRKWAEKAVRPQAKTDRS